MRGCASLLGNLLPVVGIEFPKTCAHARFPAIESPDFHAGEQAAHQNPKRKHVCSHGKSIPAQLFRRSIGDRRARCSRGRSPSMQPATDAKVQQLHGGMTISRRGRGYDHDIRWFDVTVKHKTAMCVGHCREDLYEQLQPFPDGETMSVAPCVDGSSIEVFQHQKWRAI